MNRLVLFCIIGFLLPVSGAVVAPAEEPSRYYFDHGAEQFTRDNLEKAKAWVDEGLVLYPDDVKLTMLKQLLEPPPQQQQQPNQQQQQSQPQPNPQSSPNQQPRPEDSKREQQQSGSEGQQEQQQGQGSNQMSSEEAERMLDGLKEREAAERARAAADRLRREMNQLPPVEKDW